ncbi:MAG: thymidylate synthase [Proteobacteria bacterium]|nr:thymidylate synthase [Pseudomonadota bacterium]
MRIAASSLDDLCRKLYPKLLKGGDVVPSSQGRGVSRERRGVLLELKQPLARLSRTETRGKPFSCLGELLWYLSRDNRLDFIRYYIKRYEIESEDGERVLGGYGPRLFNQRGIDQVRSIIELLKNRPSSRQAVIQLFNAEDLSSSCKAVPCTTTMQFALREERLHMLVTMRSNDAFKGLPHDIFCFTMIQELIARSVGVTLGSYKHFVGSMHLYDEDRDAAQQYLDEDIQASIAMPPMPVGDPWPAVAKLLQAEELIRNGLELDSKVFDLPAYWADLVRLLQAFAASGDPEKIQTIKSQIAFKGYRPYIESRKQKKPRAPKPPIQFIFPFGSR